MFGSKTMFYWLIFRCLKFGRSWWLKFSSSDRPISPVKIDFSKKTGRIYRRKSQLTQLPLAIRWLKNLLKNFRSLGAPSLPKLGLPTVTFPKINWPKLRLRLPKAKPRLLPPVREPPSYHPIFRYGLSLFLTILIVALAYGTYEYVIKDLPSVQNLAQRDQIITTKILDRHGRLLYSIYKDENRTVVPLSQVSEHMIAATIAIEDQSFYHHHGFSPRAIMRAFIANMRNEDVQGGSTITQQLVKNTILTPERTLQRKIKELFLSLLVDGLYTKEEILYMYFNQISYGGSTYGVESAAQRYFGKHASDLDLAESALLAGLPAAPSVYSPFGSHPELAYTRQAEVLRRMVEDGYVTQDQANAAKRQVVAFRSDATDIQAPHFVMMVRQQLAEKYGEDLVSQGGLEVTTSLDLDIQRLAEKAVAEEVSRLRGLRVSNGAALVTNPQTGEILAMVGSVNYFDFARDGQVNVTLRPRQPGSSIKPLTYATAMQRQLLNPNTIIQDTPITYHSVGSPAYSPVNYDGKFHGPVTAREALASSYNVPAVKTLALVGINSFIDQAQLMGITTWQDRQRYGLSLTLGGGEVLMTDMATAYSSFANYGYRVDLNPILEVKNNKGEPLYTNYCAQDSRSCQRLQTLDQITAFQITDILKDNRARTPAFGPQSVLHIPGQEVAVKTGTTNNLRDNWTIGYTTDFLVATWVGNNDNSPMSAVASGITGASPIWNTIMVGLLEPENPHLFPTPAGLVRVKICKTTGTLTCAGCPQVVEEIFAAGTEPKTKCNFSAGSNPTQPLASPLPRRDPAIR